MDNSMLFDLAWIGGVIGFFLPLLISLVKRATWSVQAKRALALVVSGIAGVVNTGVQAGWAFASVGEFMALALFSVIDVFVVASVIYRSFWEGTSADDALTAAGSGVK